MKWLCILFQFILRCSQTPVDSPWDKIKATMENLIGYLCRLSITSVKVAWSFKHFIQRRFYAVFLLLLYIFSNSPYILFHHHKLKIEPFEKAIVSHHADDGKSSHEAYISKTSEKCALCDSHTISPHHLLSVSIQCLPNVFNRGYLITSAKLFFRNHSIFSNRGPPLFLLFLFNCC